MINTVRFSGYVPGASAPVVSSLPLSAATEAAKALLSSIAAKKAAAEEILRRQTEVDKKRLNPVCHPMQAGMFKEAIGEMNLSPIPETLEKESISPSLKALLRAGSRDAQAVATAVKAVANWQESLSLPKEISTEEEIAEAVKAVEAWESLLLSRKGLKEEKEGILRELLPLEKALKDIPWYLKREKEELAQILLPLRARVEEIKGILEFRPLTYGGQEFYVPETGEQKKAWGNATYLVACLHLGMQEFPVALRDFLKAFGAKISRVSARTPSKASRRLFGTALYAVARLKDNLRQYWPEKLSSFEESQKKRIEQIQKNK